MTKIDTTLDFSSIDWLDEQDWAYKPAQKRSKQTLQKVLSCAMKLFINTSFEETTLAQISRESGVSIGSIYNLFSDKSAIVRALFEHYRFNRVSQIDEMAEQLLQANHTALDVIRFHIGIIYTSSSSDGAFLRLIERQRFVDQQLYDIQADSEEIFCQTMLGLYHQQHESFGHPDLETSVRYLHYVIRGSALWSLLPSSRERQFLNVSDHGCQEEAVAMAAAYLQCSCNQ